MIPAKLRPWILLGLAAIGVRLGALAWNADRLFGDVNLFAVVARDWVDHGTLNYPGKYDFFQGADYLTLSSPASQHPPAWPWLGGVTARLLDTRDTYFTLQLWSLIGGLLIVATGARLAWVLSGKKAALWCGWALCLHPYLVDYSGNGSPYLWMGLAALAVPWCALDRKLPDWGAGALAGLAVGIATSVHGAALALLPFGGLAVVIARRGGRLPAGGIYIVAAAAVMLPTCLWMQSQFGSWWHTTTTNYIWGKLGHLRMTEQADGIRFVATPLVWSDAFRAIGMAAKSTANYALYLASELGWFGLVGLATGVAWLRSERDGRRLILVFALVAIGAGLPCWLWPSFKFRFLAGLLPLAVLLAALAASRCLQTPHWVRGAITGILLFWSMQFFLTGTASKYYAFDLEHKADYAEMRLAADHLAAQPQGTVLAFSSPLDGGIEAAYWVPFPFISARGFNDSKLLRLARDFDCDYALLSPERRGFVENNFPEAELVHEGSKQIVYRLKP